MEWGPVLIALLTGGVITAVIEGGFSIVKRKMELKNAFPDAIKRIKKIYMLMDELKADIECDRVLIMSTKNGGGIPRPGAHLYASILYETYDKRLEAVMSSWQDRQVDLSYVKLLNGLEEFGIVLANTEDMSDGLLKDVYTSQGIHASIHVKVKATKNHYYYISCSFTSKKKADLQARVKIADVAARIKDII